MSYCEICPVLYEKNRQVHRVFLTLKGFGYEYYSQTLNQRKRKASFSFSNRESAQLFKDSIDNLYPDYGSGSYPHWRDVEEMAIKVSKIINENPNIESAREKILIKTTLSILEQ